MENLGENAKRLPMSLELNTSNKEKRRGVPLYLIMGGGGAGSETRGGKVVLYTESRAKGNV